MNAGVSLHAQAALNPGPIKGRVGSTAGIDALEEYFLLLRGIELSFHGCPSRISNFEHQLF
jgi:hypothetical protein